MQERREPDPENKGPVRKEFLVVEQMNQLLAAGAGGIDAAFNATLAAIGEACGLDRTFVFRFDETIGYRNTHEWVAPGVTPMISRMQSDPPTLRPAWHRALLAGEIVAVRNREDLPEGSAERQFLEEIGVRSSLKVPMRDGDRLFGVIGFDCGSDDRIWAEEDVFLLVSISRAMASVMLRHEAAAAESDTRAHLEATLSALPDLVIELSAKGELVACRSSKLPWLSGLVHAGIGSHLRDVFPPPLAEVLEAALADPQAERRVRTRQVGDHALVAPHSYEVSLAPLVGCPGDCAMNFVAVIRDLSAAERTGEMASYREGQFNAFFEMCPHPILLNDFDTGEILDGNQAFKDVFGLDPQTGRRLQVWEILPPDTYWVVDAAVEKLRARQSFGPQDAMFRRKDGTRFPVTVRCFLSTDPDGRRLVWSLIEDMTEIRMKEAALVAESQALDATRSRFVSAIEALDDGFAVFDAEDRLVLWNKPYVRVFAAIEDLIRVGALYDDLLRAAIDRGIFGVEGERDAANLQRRLDRPLDEVWDNEDEFADGRLIWVRERLTPARETVGLYEDVTARRLADRRLQEIVDSGEVAVWDWDDEQGFSRINAKWGEILGIEHDLSFEGLLSHVHPADQKLLSELQNALFVNHAEDFTVRYRRRNQSGRWVWLLSRGRVASRHANGKPRRIWGLTLDISGQTDAEQRLKQVIEGARVGTWEYDYSKQSSTVNDVWAEILGYRKDELNPLRVERWLDLVHPEDRKALLARQKTKRQGDLTTFQDELRLRHKDGYWVWVLSRGQVTEWDDEKRPLRESGIHLDITAAKALEMALARERDILARIMETSVSGIIAVDAEGGVVFTNAAAERILGRDISPDDNLVELLSRADIVDMTGRPVSASELPIGRALARKSGLHEMRHVIHWPGGERRVVSVSAAPLSAPGTGLAAVCSFTDITAEVKNEDRLRAAITTAEAASRAKSDFLAAMSHEIRTPLNGVLGMATVLSNRLADPADLEMLQIIRDSGEHLLGVINDILDLAKIEAGRMVLDPKPLRLPDTLERVVALHRHAAEEKGLRLVTLCKGGESDQRRYGDEQRIIQILHNVIGNALKFTTEGEVRVEIDQSSDLQVVITVSDTGIGMSEDEIGRAFDEFTQGAGSTGRRQEGTGLGLPIVRRLVRLMRGEVSLSSSEAGGVTARVEVQLPLLDKEAGTTDDLMARPLPPLRVLAAEDNATNRIILQSMLRALGVEAEIVADGGEAVSRYVTGRYDAVLLDIAMPGMNGLETLDALTIAAERQGSPGPRAIAVTANVMTHQVGEYLARGFAAVVAKPIRMDVLARALLHCIGEVEPVQRQAVDHADL
ncbi:MAG: PAS domain S-box protein [Tabrizicola sp.]|nr:PAS domain S-box protein [Tabrizicola sp.]